MHVSLRSKCEWNCIKTTVKELKNGEKKRSLWSAFSVDASYFIQIRRIQHTKTRFWMTEKMPIKIKTRKMLINFEFLLLFAAVSVAVTAAPSVLCPIIREFFFYAFGSVEYILNKSSVCWSCIWPHWNANSAHSFI